MSTEVQKGHALVAFQDTSANENTEVFKGHAIAAYQNTNPDTASPVHKGYVLAAYRDLTMGLFKIVGDELQVADGDALTALGEGTQPVTIKVTDTNGQTLEKEFNIEVSAPGGGGGL